MHYRPAHPQGPSKIFASLHRFRTAAGAIALALAGAASASGQGLTGLYYNNTTLSGTATLRTDAGINFTSLTPPSPIGASNFSARWTGQVIAGPQVSGGPAPTAVPTGSLPLTYPYTFQVNSNNGVRLWVNGKLVIDSWIKPQGASADTGTIRLAPNLRYDIKLEYRDTAAADTPSVQLQWSYPGQTLQAIPSARLSTQRQGLLAEYYALAHIHLEGPDTKAQTLNNFAFARTDPQIDYVYGPTGSPDATLERDNFGMRWTGNINVPTAGSYTFHVTVDEPRERVKLVINNQTLIQTATEYPGTTPPTVPYSASITLPAGNVPISMEYGEVYEGNARVKLEWSSSTIPQEVIPQARLTPPAGNELNMLLEERRFPANLGVINVKTYYGAKGDGVTDDTAALQRAISENIGWTVGFAKWLYLPAGTYLVSNTLKWHDLRTTSVNHQWRGGLGLIGDGQSQTIIKLQNNTFTAAPAKPVIMTGSGFFSTSSGIDRTIGEGNEGARNNLVDLTIDTGSGNTQAIGVDYLSSNRGYINNVTIRSSDANKVGIAALSMKRRYPGPSLVTNVTLEGFNYGVDMGGAVPEYGITFDNLTLRNQKTAGIFYQENTLQIRNLTSVGDKPVIQNTNLNGHQGFIAVIDGTFTFTGAGSPPSAITLADSRIFLRNVSATGYANVLQGVAGNTIVEKTYLNNGGTSLTGKAFTANNATTSLNLPVPATPVFDDPDLNNWVDVTTFGANFTDRLDDKAAIQNAIDSFLPGGVNASKTTLYFPSNGLAAWANQYLLSAPVTVRGNLRRIVGFNAGMCNLPNRYNAEPVQPFLSFQQTAHDVIVEGIDMGASYTAAVGACAFEHRSPKAVVIKDSSLGSLIRTAYRSAPSVGPGPLGPCFIENVIGRFFDISESQSVYARQLNLESRRTTNSPPDAPWVSNNGGKFWLLGLKMEEEGILIDTFNNGSTEVLGGLLYPAGAASVPTTRAAFRITDARMSFTLAESAYVAAKRYTIWAQETRSGTTINWGRAQMGNGFYQRNVSLGSIVPLYIGSPVP